MAVHSPTRLSLLLLALALALPLPPISNAANFVVRNQCPDTLWAGALPGGGRRLNNGEEWSFDIPANTEAGRIWARTNCQFDASGNGRCESGDCGGILDCKVSGAPPTTLAEYTLNRNAGQDTIDISLVDGFNVKMDFSPTGGCARGIRCDADIIGQCPAELKTTGGCLNPCNVHQTNQYCCTTGPCGPTDLSRFFKQRCPDAYSYPKDDPSSTFTCPGGTNYKVVFCP